MTRSNKRSCGTGSKILSMGGHVVIYATLRMVSLDGHVTQWCSAEWDKEEKIWLQYNEDPDPLAKNWEAQPGWRLWLEVTKGAPNESCWEERHADAN